MEPTTQPGDFLLVRGTGLIDRLIQLGQSRRFGREYRGWSHVALIVSTQGDLIEAVRTGVIRSHMQKYPLDTYRYVPIIASTEDRLEAVRFAESCLGQTYGYVNFLSTALAALTGLKFSFGLGSTEICSGLVARSLERTNAIFSLDPGNIPPAYLAKYYTPEK